MSDPIVAFRPFFPWTLAVATTNGDVIIRHLPTSQARQENEKIVLMTGSMLKNMQWSAKGDFLLADHFLLAFKLDNECTFLGAQPFCAPRSCNGLVRVSVDQHDVLKTTAAVKCPDLRAMPPQIKNKVAGLCAVATLCSPFSPDVINRMAELLVYVELNASHCFY